MATRIRLQRHGKKGNPFFHLVAADSKARRDGKFIEKLGTYNPNTNPATIEMNFDRTLHWVQVGAEMSETARAILSYKGVLFKSHLLKGVDKGAFTLEEAENKFNVFYLLIFYFRIIKFRNPVIFYVYHQGINCKKISL